MTRIQWPKDALIPDLARGCCLRSSRGPASNLATGSKHKRFILGFWLREVALHLSQELAGEQGLQSTWLAAQGGLAKAGERQGDQAKVSTLLYQVLLLVVSAGERDIVKIFPERKIYIKSSSIVCLSLSGLIEGRHLLGKSHL